MANPYQTALTQRLNPNRNTGVSGIYSENGQVNAPPFLGDAELPAPPAGAPPMQPPTVMDTAGPAQPRSALNGFESSKMNAGHAAKSPKYAFGMLAQEFADTPDGLLQMSKDPRFAQAGFQYLGKDKIMAPDPDQGGRMGTVDVGLGFSDGGGKGWQWGAEPHEISAEMPAQSVSSMAPTTMPTFGQDDITPLPTNQFQDGKDPNQRSAFLEALLAQLTGPDPQRML